MRSIGGIFSTQVLRAFGALLTVLPRATRAATSKRAQAQCQMTEK